MAASQSNNLEENCEEMSENYSTKIKRTAGEPLDPSTAGDPVESNGFASDHAAKRPRASELGRGSSDLSHTRDSDGTPVIGEGHRTTADGDQKGFVTTEACDADSGTTAASVVNDAARPTERHEVGRVEANQQPHGAEDNGSDISDLSGLGLDERELEPGTSSWIRRQMARGVDPRVYLRSMLNADVDADAMSAVFANMDDMALWVLLGRIVAEPAPRRRLEGVTTIDDVVGLLRRCRNIIVLTGAGVSVSCGIPDFRSRDGIYARLAVDYPDLPDPHAMFDIRYFRRNPNPFFKFAKEIYPGQFQPSASHRFIRMIEQRGHLLRNYTQNIDTLEQCAGMQRVVQCHGSFATATCMLCRRKVSVDEIREDIMNQVIPLCTVCKPLSSAPPAAGSEPEPEPVPAIMKPDIVFFGESLPDEFHDQMERDKERCDLLIVMGSSLKVRPVALIPSMLPAGVPQVLINREPLRDFNFDVELLGDCDTIVNELCHLLAGDWLSLATTVRPARPITELDLLDLIPDLPQRVVSGSTGIAGDDEAGTANSRQPITESIDSTDTCSAADLSNAGCSVITETGEVSGVAVASALLVERSASSSDVDDSKPVAVPQCNRSIADEPSATSDQAKEITSGITDFTVESKKDPSTDSFDSSNRLVAETRSELEPANQSAAERKKVEPMDTAAMKESASLSSVAGSDVVKGEEDSLERKKESSAVDRRPVRGRNIATLLPADSYVHLPPRRYVFSGAELTASLAPQRGSHPSGQRPSYPGVTLSASSSSSSSSSDSSEGENRGQEEGESDSDADPERLGVEPETRLDQADGGTVSPSAHAEAVGARPEPASSADIEVAKADAQV